MVKQQPIEADASVVPMETETNIKEDEGEVHGKAHHNSLVPEDEESSMMTDLTSIINSGEQSLQKYFSRLGVDVANITTETEFPFGPTIAQLCSTCRLARQRNYNGVPTADGLRYLVMDCRIDML